MDGIAAVCIAAEKDNFKALIEKGILESIPDLTSWRTQIVQRQVICP
jgi:hypothetical protein